MALRSDYLGHLQSVEELRLNFEEFSLRPLALSQIPAIIEGPAGVAGIRVDDALVQQAVQDAQTEDALPLLAFTLRELLDKHGGNGHLSIQDYAALGDPAANANPLENAVRRSADQVLVDARPSLEELRALREAFVPALVRINENLRLRRFTIGLYPRISLAGARETARDALRDAHHGKDRAAEKIDARRAETFGELASEYIERHASKKRSGREDTRLLNGSPHKKKTGEIPHVPVVKRWGSRKVKDIQRRDVRELLDDIAARAPIMANRTLALVRKMFNFAIEHDWLEVNPCQMIKRLAPERQRDRVLSEDEIRALWKALDSEDAIIAAVFRLRLLTAQRGGRCSARPGTRWT